MKAYVVMIHERHSDPDCEVFTDAEAAVAYARATAEKYARDPEDIEEEDIESWLYYARWSYEGDDVWVVEKEVVG